MDLPGGWVRRMPTRNHQRMLTDSSAVCVVWMGKTRAGEYLTAMRLP